MTRTAAAIARGVIVAGFVWGTLTHAADWWRYGWWPYRFGPPMLNAFWNALVLLDAMTVVLLLRRDLRAGLMLAIVVMVADVAANSYAWRMLGVTAFEGAVPIQAAFLGYVVGAVPLLWFENAKPEQFR
ncbi:hypothetical protein [Sphingomonas sp. Mn802worker]|uniref:hypothetical protein n=1 Tax=Sphingomonas sp. Mn802worker TaxID=629773 RepID=UPI00037AC2C3|nr:hypothetical protein [Sphingomonas sp. Mn802worker]